MPGDWSVLPSDPLGAIVMKFDNLVDFINFSAVCQQWNCASSAVKHQWTAPLPSLLLAENTKENLDHLRQIFSFNDDQFFHLKLRETFGTRCWGSAYGWVAVVDDNRNVQLFNPITKARIHFPSLKTLAHYTDDVDEYYNEDYKFLRFYLFRLIVLKVSRDDNYEFVIMVIYDNEQYVDFAKHGDESWTSVSTKKFEMDEWRRLYTRVDDVIAKNEEIFALYGDGSIVHWHAREFCSGQLLNPTDYSPPGTSEIVSRHIDDHVTKYLVECHGDLILVVRYTNEHRCHYEDESDDNPGEFVYQTIAFDVFKLTKCNGWEKIEDLGNVALFVGGNYSMSISLGEAQCFHHNLIYFTDDRSDYWGKVRGFGGHDTGFYDMKLDKIEFFTCHDLRSLFCPSTWFLTKL